MSNTGPFDLHQSERYTSLLVDGSWLDVDDPIQVWSGLRVALGPDPNVRIQMTHEEATKLWRLLDRTIGAHVREGEVVREAFEQTKAEGLDTRLPGSKEYEAAIEVVATKSVPTDSERFQQAVDTIRVYERAHGMKGA